MSLLDNFLAGRQILEEIESPTNGKLIIVKELAWGIHIMADGITQSGGIAQDIWKRVFRSLAQKNFENTLIIGLGGGGIAKLISKNWNTAKITGVEIDPVMVKLGKKYLGLDKINLQVKIQDGLKFCKNAKEKYDLICIDTYLGQEYPKKFSTKNFFQNVLKILTKDGVAVFNRLYFGEKKQEANEFRLKLEKVFSKVEDVRPEANIMFLCSHS